MVKVKYDDLSAAFDFVSFAAPFEHQAFVSLDTGAIHWVSETGPIDEEDPPDDLETSDRYIAIPHKNDLDLTGITSLCTRRPQAGNGLVIVTSATTRGCFSLDEI